MTKAVSNMKICFLKAVLLAFFLKFAKMVLKAPPPPPTITLGLKFKLFQDVMSPQKLRLLLPWIRIKCTLYFGASCIAGSKVVDLHHGTYIRR